MRTRWMLIGMLAIAAGALGIKPMMRASSASPVSVPHSADVVSDDTHASTARPSAFVPAPASEAPGTLTLQAPPIEPQEVLDSMTKDELKAEIAHIDEELEKRDAVKRLNEERVSPEERVELGAMIHRESLMKNQLVTLELNEVDQAVAEYEKGHAARVAQYLHKKN